MDEVQSLLFSVSMDERGDGVVSMNHCNIYRDLCHSIGYYPQPTDSREFAFDPQFLDSAFTVPAFQLAISEFTEGYFPELLGMTLMLEWEVVQLKQTRDSMIYTGLDAHFYIMHIGIDNAVNGHGQRAPRCHHAVPAEPGAASGGDTAVQAAWRRIWNGFVAFSTIGTFGNDLLNLISATAEPAHADVIDDREQGQLRQQEPPEPHGGTEPDRRLVRQSTAISSMRWSRMAISFRATGQTAACCS